MCICTLKKQNYLKKIKDSLRGCATLPNVSKLGVSGVKDTAKTNKDWSMSCYIQVKNRVFFSIF